MSRIIGPLTFAPPLCSLYGEVRQVAHAGRRLGEAVRLGFHRAIVPVSSPEVSGIRMERVATIGEALAVAGILRHG